jgi:hypothetical protein
LANPEHLKILKRGIKVWNRWREENPDVEVNLSGSHLHAGYSLSIESYEFPQRTNTIGINLSRADLNGACFNDDDLDWADLRDANLTGAYFFRAHLFGVNLNGADLSGANFSDARIGSTIFSNNDLSKVKGLESVHHEGPSEISSSTLYRSAGKIPEEFVRGCGLSNWEIESAKLHQKDLSTDEIGIIVYNVHNIRAERPIQINPLFISYSHADCAFVDAVEEQLNELGVRFWRDVHHATAGRLERVVDRAIRLNPTVLLVLSENSVNSDWVEHEARLARKLEIESKRDVLCPVALDDSWERCRWPERLRERIMEYHILDFSNWSREASFKRVFAQLIEGLNLFYKEVHI